MVIIIWPGIIFIWLSVVLELQNFMFVSTSVYLGYWLYANSSLKLMLFFYFECRHTWEYKYLGFTSSALSVLLRSLSKQTLRILTTQWNQGLVEILNLGVNRMR